MEGEQIRDPAFYHSITQTFYISIGNSHQYWHEEDMLIAYGKQPHNKIIRTQSYKYVRDTLKTLSGREAQQQIVANAILRLLSG